MRTNRGVASNQILGEPDLKNIDLPGVQINDPSLGKHFSLMFLPATPSSPSCVPLPELQRNKETIKFVVLGSEVPGHSQKQLTQTWIVTFGKKPTDANLDLVFVKIPICIDP